MAETFTSRQVGVDGSSKRSAQKRSRRASMIRSSGSNGQRKPDTERFSDERLDQNILPPIGTVLSGESSTTFSSASGTPSTNTSERKGPICLGGKLTTAIISLPINSSFV